MSLKTPIDAIGIISTNSIGYVEAVFKAYALNQVVVPLQNAEQVGQILGVNFVETVTPNADTGWHRKKITPIHSTDIAQISFTSGTEGTPKGILLSHSNLADVTERLNNIMMVDASIREYVGVPVTYSFGLARIRACAAVGGAAYIPENGFNPLEIAKMLKNDDINAISAVPTLWRTLLQNQDVIGELGARVKWIEIGSQFMAQNEKEELKNLFPNAKIIQHYGLTEASRASFLDITALEGTPLSSVGVATGDTTLAINDNNTIKIKGPHTAKYALQDGQLISLLDADGWLQTNDIGELTDGYLYFKGRNDDLINCGGIKISPDAIERDLAAIIGNNDGFAIGRIDDPLRGDGIVIACERSAGIALDTIEKAISEILKRKNIQIGTGIKSYYTDHIERTETGKVKRNLLAKHFPAHSPEGAKQPEDNTLSQQPLSNKQKELVDIWCQVLSVDNVSIDASFYDFGGDSLSAINLMLSMERLGIDQAIINDIVAGKTIADVTGGSENTGSSGGQLIAKTSEAINAVRGFMVLFLVFIHWSPGVFQRLSIDYERITYPFFRLGTPGFAIIFGLGTGFFIFHQFSINRIKALKNIKIATLMLMAGISLTALVRYLQIMFEEPSGQVYMAVQLFYSVLLYYLLAVLSIPLWYALIRKFKYMELATLVGSAVMFSLSFLIKIILPNSAHLDGISRLVGLMLEAKYSYFNMSAAVFLGIALGLYVRRQMNEGRKLTGLLPCGLILMFSGLLYSYLSGQLELWFTAKILPIWMIITYFGVIMVLLSGALIYRYSDVKPNNIKFVFNILAIFGLLSLPMYIGHGIVLPIKGLLNTFGLSSPVSISLSIAMFGIAIFFPARKLFQIYYGKS